MKARHKFDEIMLKYNLIMKMMKLIRNLKVICGISIFRKQFSKHFMESKMQSQEIFQLS